MNSEPGQYKSIAKGCFRASKPLRHCR